MSWVQQRLDELGYTHQDLKSALAELGIVRVRATITGWTNGKPIKLLSNPDDTKKLAEALNWSVLEMLIAAGYEVDIPSEILDFIYEYKVANQTRKIIYMKNIAFVSGFMSALSDDELDIPIGNM